MSEPTQEFSRYLIDMIVGGDIKDRDQFQNEKVWACKRFGLSGVPSNSVILKYVTDDERGEVLPFLLKKPMRTMSGVAAVAVMSSPYPCPHGKCMYCPGGVENNSPQSYTGKEPAARRADRNGFDPYRQVTERISQLEAIGHITDKIDLIIMGGTFTSREIDYQTWFVKRCFDAMNGRDAPDVATAHEWNETAEHRCVGLTVETRPDVFDDSQIETSMSLGATRVELGVQILDDEILKFVERGHGVKEVVECTKRCKEHGLKICYHIMPGLPHSDPDHDLECFRKVIDGCDFKPDMLKFYTTLVTDGTKLHRMWKDGEYEPYDVEKASDLIAEMKAIIPEYVRIQRIQRDIPAPQIVAGILQSNIREVVQEKLAASGRRCRCIRCREVGHNGIELTDENKLKLDDLVYEASGGQEHFINITYGDYLVGYARLRLDECATVRELKVFGKMAKIGGDVGDWQHRGFGKTLLNEAERIAKSDNKSRIRVTSGVGVRGYYRMHGYRLEKPYMVKDL